MGVTMVLSGPAFSRTQALALTRQAGLTADAGEDPHGFDVQSEESFVTAHGNHPDQIAVALEQIGWRLRSHWESGAEGQWSNVGGVRTADALTELQRLRADLRAAGIVLPEG